MLGKRKGLIIRQILRVLSCIYLVLIKIRICGYRHHLLQTKRLPVKVISVGNLTVGGSGKTPAIIEIASLLQHAGKRVGVLIRGYRGRYEHQQGVVSDGGREGQSAVGSQQSASEEGQSAVGSQQSASEEGQAAGGKEQPAVGSQQAAGGEGQPAVGSQQSAGGEGQPAVGSRQSAGGEEQSAVGSQQSAVGEGQPAVGSRGRANPYPQAAADNWQAVIGTEDQQYASVPYPPLPSAHCLQPSAFSLQPFLAGDEACLLARNLPGIPVLAGKNRWASGKYAVEKFGCDTLLLDDGFQHLKLYRDADILLYDVSIPEQGLRLFPEGVLREPLHAAKRARVIVLTHTDMVADITPWMNMIKGLNPGALILTSIHLPLCLIRGQGAVGNRQSAVGSKDQPDLCVYPLSSISGKKILACSGIGCPESFEHSLKQFDPNSIIPLRFPDHHQYDPASMARIEEMARGVDMVVTTEKDMIRLENEMQKGEYSMPLFFLKMRLEIITPNWQEDLLRVIVQ